MEIRTKEKPFKVLPVMLCRKEQLEEQHLVQRIKELQKNLVVEVSLLKEVVVNDEKDLTLLENYVEEADAILLFKPHLGMGDLVIKMVELNLPVIIFNREGEVRNPLDALEYVYPEKNVWVAIDYQDINFRLKILKAKKLVNNTRLLILNADYPHWERLLCRISGGIETIKERLGINVEYVLSDEVIKRWQGIEEGRIKPVVEKWMRMAEKIIEPKEEDLKVVARLYLVMHDLLNERNAQGLTMAYGDNPLPVPCFAYTNLRDEGIPSACEVDIISLLTMTILHHLTDKPSFMGNTFVDLQNNILALSHCVAPTKMAGYDKSPYSYILRDQHWDIPLGSVSAFVGMKPDQEVTICRLDGQLKNLLITKGKIVDCQDLKDRNYCRITVRIKLETSIRKFIRNASGNHQVLIYGDHREEIRAINELFGITTIEV
jgi:hypothetical protein